MPLKHWWKTLFKLSSKHRSAASWEDPSLAYMLSFVWIPPLSTSLSLQSVPHNEKHAPEQTSTGFASTQDSPSASRKAYQKVTTSDDRQLSVTDNVQVTSGD